MSRDGAYLCVEGSSSIGIFDEQGNRLDGWALSYEVKAIKLGPNGSRIFVLGSDRRVHVLDLSGNEILAWASGVSGAHAMELHSIGYSVDQDGDGDYLPKWEWLVAVASEDMNLFSLDGEFLAARPIGVQSRGQARLYGRHYSFYTVGGGNSQVMEWSAITGEPVTGWIEPELLIRSVFPYGDDIVGTVHTALDGERAEIRLYRHAGYPEGPGIGAPR